MDERFLDALTAEEAGDPQAAGRRRSYPARVRLFHEGGAGPVRRRGDRIGALSAIDGGHITAVDSEALRRWAQ